MENMKFSHKDVENMIFWSFPFQKRIRLTQNYLVFFVFSYVTIFWGNNFYSFYLPYFQYELYWSCLVDIRVLGSINCLFFNCLLFTFEWFLTLFICIGMHFECVYVSNDSYLFVACRFMLYIDRKTFKIMQINGANLCYFYEQWVKFCWFNFISDTLFDWIGQNGSQFLNYIEKLNHLKNVWKICARKNNAK